MEIIIFHSNKFVPDFHKLPMKSDHHNFTYKDILRIFLGHLPIVQVSRTWTKLIRTCYNTGNINWLLCAEDNIIWMTWRKTCSRRATHWYRFDKVPFIPDENICKHIASVHVFVILKGAHFYNILTTSELVVILTAFEKLTFKTKLYIIFIYRYFWQFSYMTGMVDSTCIARGNLAQD